MAYTLYKPAAPAIRGVLFDMDGLVLDTESLYSRFWMEACHFYGFPMTKEQSLQMRSLIKSAGQEKLTSFFGPGVSYSAIRHKRIELMDAYIAQNGVQPKPGIFELMDYLEANSIPAAITSSSPMNRILDYLTPYGLTHRFSRLCSGHDIPRGKPFPDIYLLGAASLELKPEECLALEDSPAGILSAYRAGCHSVMIPDLHQPDSDTLPLLYAKADSLHDIIRLLEDQK